MERTKSPREWFDSYVQKGRLLNSIMKSISEIVKKENMDVDGEVYIGLVNDVVSGNNGQYVPFYALEYFDYDIDTENIEQYDLGDVIDELDGFTGELADIINEEILYGMNVSVHFGYWESDGSYCMMVFIPKDVYEKGMERFKEYMSG